MNKYSLALLSMALLLGASASAADNGKAASINGYVIDSACAYTKNLDKPISRDCALKCAKGGSHLVILSDDKNVYWPISDKVPAEGQNPRLLKYAGERVSVSGQVYDRGGSKAIVIDKIDSAK